MSNLLSLETRRFVPASPERVFAAWTDPHELEKWWGPANVRCISAEIDLRVGGQYRIANEFPDKAVIWIHGVYQQIDRPHLLVFTWQVGADSSSMEIVMVRMTAQDRGTEVFVKHELIASSAMREQHLQGWQGCLDGLSNFLATGGRPLPSGIRLAD